jgi:hypothetical protein
MQLGEPRLGRETIKTMVLEADIVVAVEIVHPYHLIPAVKQQGADPRADKPSTTRKQNFHYAKNTVRLNL